MRQIWFSPFVLLIMCSKPNYILLFVRYVYIFCEKAERNAKGGWDYEVKPYKPADFLLQDIAVRLSSAKPVWDLYVKEGEKLNSL